MNSTSSWSCAAHAQRSVTGVDQFDGGVHDRPQGLVEFEARGDHQHGLDQTVEPVATLDDLLDAVLHFHEQFPQPQLRQGVTHWMRARISVGPAPGHDDSLTPHTRAARASGDSGAQPAGLSPPAGGLQAGSKVPVPSP